MLNIFKLKENKQCKPKIIKSKGDFVGKPRHYPPANKEWFNSIYAYDKNTVKLLPSLDNFVARLIRSYFNMFSRKLERKTRARRIRLWMRRLSTNRILISKPELKHTSDKVMVTLYIYNRQKGYYIRKMKKLKKKTLKIKLIKIKSLYILKKIRKEKNFFFNTLNWKKTNFERNYYVNFIRKSLRKIMFYMRFKQIMHLNKSKFKSTYILPVKSLVEKIYRKKVEFNLVTLKNYHLNSDIFSQILAIKIRNRKNRLLRVLKASLRNIKLPLKNRLEYFSEIPKEITVQNLIVNDFLLMSSALSSPKRRTCEGQRTWQSKQATPEKENNADLLDKILSSLYPPKFVKKLVRIKRINESKKITIYTGEVDMLWRKENLENIVLDSIKHKTVSGIRIEAAGRLTRRLIAARAIFKIKHIGTIKNINSSYKGLSSVILRGNLKSNVQFSKIKNKTRIGAFGLKGWISSI